MIKSISIIVLAVMFFSACELDNTYVYNITDKHGVYIDKQNEINSMLTDMPVYEDNGNVYYVEGGKTLKVVQQDNKIITLDKCSNRELIEDIYADEEYIYYIKQCDSYVDIIKINKENTEDREVVFETTDIGISMGRDFVYVENNTVYYYNSAYYTLYISDNDSEKHINDITGVVIYDRNIYYADKTMDLYVCDNSLSSSNKIWSIDSIDLLDDDELQRWSQINISDISMLRDLSVDNGRLFFTIRSTANTSYGALFSVKLNGEDTRYYNGLRIPMYQLYNDSICFPDSNLNSQIKVHNQSSNKQSDALNINRRHLYLSGDWCYYWENEEEYTSLRRINLIDHSIQEIGDGSLTKTISA